MTMLNTHTQTHFILFWAKLPQILAFTYKKSSEESLSVLKNYLDFIKNISPPEKMQYYKSS